MPMTAAMQTELPVQRGSGIGRGKRYGPPKRQRNTIPSTQLVMYHQ
jgi:hypothetical protein